MLNIFECILIPMVTTFIFMLIFPWIFKYWDWVKRL